MRREFPSAPLVAVGGIMVRGDYVLLVRRRYAPLRRHWTLPGGALELGETLAEGVVREVQEETGLVVEPVELIALVDRIHRLEERVQFHYVIADYLCRIIGGELKAASDAGAVRWVKRSRWRGDSPLALDSLTASVIEKGLQRARLIWPEQKMRARNRGSI